METSERLDRQEIAMALDNYQNVDGHAHQDGYQYLVAEALSVVPKDLALHAVRCCLFRVFDSHTKGFLLRSKDTAGRDSIFVKAELLDDDPEEAVKAILHELAHLYFDTMTRNPLLAIANLRQRH